MIADRLYRAADRADSFFAIVDVPGGDPDCRIVMVTEQVRELLRAVADYAPGAVSGECGICGVDRPHADGCPWTAALALADTILGSES